MGGRDSMKANAVGRNKGGATTTNNAPSRTRPKRPSARVSLRPPPPVLTESESSEQRQQRQQQQHQKQLQSNTRKQDSDLEYGAFGGDKEENLASAVMVANCSYMTEEDNSFFPIGVEFDPDAKIRAQKRTIRVYYMVLAALLLVALVVGLAVGLVNKKKKDVAKGYRETLGIQQVLENITGLSLTKPSNMDPSTSKPYLQALDWIIHTDPTEPLPEDSNFLQRFIAAYIYFASSVDHEWAWCAPPTPYSNNTCTFLEKNRFHQGFSKVTVGSRWLSGTDECTWVGFYCDEEKQVETINLNGMNMSGLFPEGIQFLTSLSELRLGEGNLRGPLPTVLSQMKRLVFLQLHSNKFTGPIPSEWYQDWTHLQYLDLSDNKLSGTIAPEIGSWKELEEFGVENNLLSGSIPSEIGELTNALWILLSDNLISGPIPDTIRNLISLQRFEGSNNKLTGLIPQEISLVSNLNFLFLSDNLLSGTIDVLYETEKLEEVDLSGNTLTGTISPQIAQMTKLYVLLLRDNDLSGQLPTELGLLQVKGGISFAGNNFTGSVPQQLCNVQFQENDVANDVVTDVPNVWSLEADCRGPLDCPEGCCTTCCMPGGIDCLSMDSATP